jgi:hypothetical protein
VWIDHFRKTDRKLAELLDGERVVMHPFVIAELALGHLPNRYRAIETLQLLPSVPTVSQIELIRFIESNSVPGKGLGFVDVHLLAAARLVSGTVVWSRDRRLNAEAKRLSIEIETET